MTSNEARQVLMDARKLVRQVREQFGTLRELYDAEISLSESISEVCEDYRTERE